MTISVGNIAPNVTENDIREAFSAYGVVSFVNIVRDRLGRVSKGFGFLSMPVQMEAEAAITALHGKELKGQTLVVGETRPLAR